MKKIKVMLTAITLFAIVGGALAFKAYKKDASCYYSSTTSHQGGTNDHCLYNMGTGTTTGGSTGTRTYATTKSKVNGACPTGTAISCPVLISTAAQP